MRILPIDSLSRQSVSLDTHFNKKLLIVLLGAVIIGFAQVSLKVGSENLSVTHNLAIRALGLTTSIGLPFLKLHRIMDNNCKLIMKLFLKNSMMQ